MNIFTREKLLSLGPKEKAQILEYAQVRINLERRNGALNPNYVYHGMCWHLSDGANLILFNGSIDFENLNNKLADARSADSHYHDRFVYSDLLECLGLLDFKPMQDDIDKSNSPIGYWFPLNADGHITRIMILEQARMKLLYF